jgi:DNA replication regulator DPB11
VPSLIIKNGGTLTSEATRDLTHVIVFGDNRGEPERENVENRDKIKWARRTNSIAKKESGSTKLIKIVWEEWFWDCIALKGTSACSLNFGALQLLCVGRCNEENYDVTRPRPARDDASGRWSSLSCYLSDVLTNPWLIAPLGSWPPPSLLFSHPSTPAPVIHQHHYRSSSLDPATIARLDTPETSADLPPRRNKGKSRAFPAIPLPNGLEGDNISRKDDRKAESSARTSQPSPLATAATPPSSSIPLAVSSGSTSEPPKSQFIVESPLIFVGMKFQVLGDADSPALLGALRDSGGTVLSPSGSNSKTDDVDFIIVRLARYVMLRVWGYGSVFLAHLISAAPFFRDASRQDKARFRTECWVEQCLFEGRIADPEENIVYSPLRTKVPVEGVCIRDRHLIRDTHDVITRC